MDGPKLPVEFARISRDGRLTLVILEGAAEQQTYWSVSEFESLNDARRNLKDREGVKSDDAIHHLSKEGRAAGCIPQVVHERVKDWLATRKEIGAAIWTGLTTNWKEKRCRDFSDEDAVRYLKELESERDRATTAYERAREYVKNTPPLIQTNLRQAMQKKGWSDAELPKILFEQTTSRTPPKKRRGR